MGEHVRILAILHIVFGALGVLGALIVLGIFGFGGAIVGAAAVEDPDAIAALPFIGIIGTGLFILILLTSIPGLAAGIGLLKFRPWARILTIVLSAFQLFNVPIGTALGVYGLWVLLNRDAEQIFSGAAPSAPSHPVQP